MRRRVFSNVCVTVLGKTICCWELTVAHCILILTRICWPDVISLEDQNKCSGTSAKHLCIRKPFVPGDSSVA